MQAYLLAHLQLNAQQLLKRFAQGRVVAQSAAANDLQHQQKRLSESVSIVTRQREDARTRCSLESARRRKACACAAFSASIVRL